MGKREPMTALTLCVLIGASLGRLGTGIAALATQSHYYSDLHTAIDMDMQRIEDSISYLQNH